MSGLDLLVAAELLEPAAGGAERFLAEALVRLPSTWRARAVYLRMPEGPGLRLPERVERRPIEPPAVTGAYWRDKRLRREAIARGVERAIAVRRPDLVLTQLHAGPGAIAAAGAAGVPAVLRIPSYETLCKYAFDAGSACRPSSGCHGCPTALGLPAAERAELGVARAGHAAALAAARALVLPSAFVAARVEEWSGRTATVIHSVDGRPTPVDARGGAVVTAAARWSANKGLDLLAPLARALPDRRLVVAGVVADGREEAALRRLPNVELRGYQPLAELAACAAVALVPSSWPEPFGRTAFELQALGVPTLARAVGGLPEVVPEPGLVPADAGPAAWARRIRALEDPAARAALRAAAAERVDAIVASRPIDRLVELLATAAATGPPGRSPSGGRGVPRERGDRPGPARAAS